MREGETVEQSSGSFFYHFRKARQPSNMPGNHYHSCYEIYYLSAGDRHYFINDRTYYVKKGDLVLINSNEIHRTTQAVTATHERYLVNFDRPFIQEMLTDSQFDLPGLFASGPLLNLDVRTQLEVEQILRKMHREHKKKSSEQKLYLKVLLIEMLLTIHRYLLQYDKAEPPFPSTMQERISQMTKYINENFMNPLSLKAMADYFYINKFYLCKIFRQFTGFSVVEYLNLVRVKEAQRLLRSSRLSVMEITVRTGFESATHFGRVFKRITGISPLQYRKQ